MKKLHNVLYLLLVFISAQLFAMELPDNAGGTSGTESLFSTDVLVLQKIAGAMNRVPKGGYVGVDNPFLTNPLIIKALKNCAQRGVQTVVNMSFQSAKVADELRVAGVQVNIILGLHAKRCLMADSDPENKEKKQNSNVVFVGSHNLSNLAPHHNEVMMRNDDCELFRQHWTDHRRIASGNIASHLGGVLLCSPQKVVDQTPVKQKIFNSRKRNARDSKIRRIHTLLTSNGNEDWLDITSMTFDSEEITKAISDVKKERAASVTIRLILDKSALRHTDLLEKLCGAGVWVYIFNPDGDNKIWNKYPKLQHTKTLIRKCGDTYLVINSTGNLTKQSNREINIDSYHPEEETLFYRIKAFNDELIKQSVSYDKVVKGLAERKRKAGNSEQGKKEGLRCEKRSKKNNSK